MGNSEDLPKRPKEADPRKRYRKVAPAPGLPMWAIVDDEFRAAIGMTWTEPEADRIVDALNAWMCLDNG